MPDLWLSTRRFAHAGVPSLPPPQHPLRKHGRSLRQRRRRCRPCLDNAALERAQANGSRGSLKNQIRTIRNGLRQTAVLSSNNPFSQAQPGPSFPLQPAPKHVVRDSGPQTVRSEKRPSGGVAMQRERDRDRGGELLSVACATPLSVACATPWGSKFLRGGRSSYDKLPELIRRHSRNLSESRITEDAARANCIIKVSWGLRHAAEHSPKTSTWSKMVTCGAHAHQGSRLQPNTHALVHSVHRAHRVGGTLTAVQCYDCPTRRCGGGHHT